MTAGRLSAPAAVRAAVDARLAEFLADAAHRLREISPAADRLTEPLRAFATGGKRVRAMLTWWGHEIGGGEPGPAIASAAGSVELLHAAALVHDDVIDASETRRGSPAVHTRFSREHAAGGWAGDSALYGASAAIVAGDLCLALSEELFGTAGLPVSAEARTAHDALRRDVMLGQFLDIDLQARPVPREELFARASEVLTHKTALYTVVQPLALGAALAGAGPELLAALERYGRPVGRAFQMRDDVLGVFGEPATTGKPAGDDLVQGKKTLLVAEVLARADAEQADWFASRLGDPGLTPGEIARMTALIADCGAAAELEERIERERAEAEAGLRTLRTLGVAEADVRALAAFADELTHRRA